MRVEADGLHRPAIVNSGGPGNSNCPQTVVDATGKAWVKSVSAGREVGMSAVSPSLKPPPAPFCEGVLGVGRVRARRPAGQAEPIEAAGTQSQGLSARFNRRDTSGCGVVRAVGRLLLCGRRKALHSPASVAKPARSKPKKAVPEAQAVGKMHGSQRTQDV